VPLYLTGESYAGHYIPALGNAIYKHNAALAPGNPAYIPLAGLAIGDGWIDPVRGPCVCMRVCTHAHTRSVSPCLYFASMLGTMVC